MSPSLTLFGQLPWLKGVFAPQRRRCTKLMSCHRDGESLRTFGTWRRTAAAEGASAERMDVNTPLGTKSLVAGPRLRQLREEQSWDAVQDEVLLRLLQSFRDGLLRCVAAVGFLGP